MDASTEKTNLWVSSRAVFFSSRATSYWTRSL